MSENILATSYKTSDEALKTANQIRRASLVVKEEEGFWKILIIKLLAYQLNFNSRKSELPVFH